MGRLKLLMVTLSVAVVGVVSTTAVLTTRNSVFSSSANNKPECAYHHGNHYEAVEATIDHAGHAEFWACCDCGHQYLVRPEGDFHDNEESAMIGVIDDGHIAYIAPLNQGGKDGDYWVNDPFDD